MFRCFMFKCVPLFFREHLMSSSSFSSCFINFSCLQFLFSSKLLFSSSSLISIIIIGKDISAKIGYLPNFAILFLFSKSSFWYGFYLKNENEKFLFYLKYKENMCGSWFASQFTPPIPPPTNQPNAEIWHINVSVPKTKRWIIQIKNFHFCYQKNKTKQNKT